VRGSVDLTGLLASPPEVLNGIAWDPVGERLFVTGKLWPTLFEIRLVPVPQP
jgi:glutamine cyclotransferase